MILSERVPPHTHPWSAPQSVRQIEKDNKVFSNKLNANEQEAAFYRNKYTISFYNL